MLKLLAQIEVRGDPGIHGRVLEIVRRRYGGDLFRPATDGEKADIEVLVTPPGRDPIYVVDNRRHTALTYQISREIGPPRAQGTVIDDEPFHTDPEMIRLRFLINAEAQKRLFQEFMESVPAILGRNFPITAEGSPMEVRLVEYQVESPNPYASSWTFFGRVSVLDHRDGRSIVSGWIEIFRILGPEEDGRLREPGIKVGRTFDEIWKLSPLSRGERIWIWTQIQDRLKDLGDKAELSFPKLFGEVFGNPD